MPAGAPGVLGKVLNCSEILLKTGHHLQRLAGLGVGAPGGFDALLGLRWHRHLLGEFRASRELAEPDAEARMQPGDRMATERGRVGRGDKAGLPSLSAGPPKRPRISCAAPAAAGSWNPPSPRAARTRSGSACRD